MAKTKYPNQIDTPSELPVVRDNIFEIGSDAINSLRSAIIQIEKTLGINPQGSVGLTVGERISQSLDSSGNIKREAIDRAGVIFGPIFDDQISDSAAIKESKLKLNFPTNVLQSQISYTSSLIEEIQVQVEQISSKLSAHLSPDATNRHPATAISTTGIGQNPSSSAVKSVLASNVQSVLESIFSSHINYDGSLISDLNNSHTAEQIYFNNSNTPDITSTNVQNALEDVASFLQQEVVEHQNLLHSAGSSRVSKIYDISELNYGTIYISAASLTVNKNLGEKPYFEVILDLPTPVLSEEIKIGDIVELTVNSIKKEYQIYKTNYDSLKENIVGFLLFGTFSTNEVGVLGKVFSRRLKPQSDFGMVASARENIGLSSSNIVQIINLDGPYIESKEINPNEISLTNRYFDLKINGVNYSFDVYNSTINKQSIDSIIKAINETVDYLGLSILAFRIDKENKRSEIVIAHNVSSNDLAEASLEIVRVDGSIDSLGLSSYESVVVYGKPGSSHYIGGKKYTGLLKKLDLTGFDIQSGSRNINSGALGISFLDYNLKKGDIVNIVDSFYNSYEITDITSSYISVSPRQLPAGFTSEAIATARLIIYESSLDVSNSEFLKIGVESSPASGSSLFEIFLDQNRFLNANLILEQQSEVYSDKSIYQILDFNNSGGAESIQINFENTDDSCVNIWLDSYSEKKKVIGDFNYIKLKSNLNNFECLVFVPTASGLHDYAAGVGGYFSKIIYLNNKLNRENNLIISNIHYSNQLGKFDGGINGSFFVPSLNFGNLDEKDISTKLKNILTETPIKDLRSSGFISGLKITSITDPDGYSIGHYFVSIEAGICYIDGKRFSVSSIDMFDTGIDAAEYDKLYVGIDYNGNFVFSGPNSTCSYPWSEEQILLIGTIENTGTYYNIIDQRLFINDLDLKLLNSITVSPQPGMGHFTDIRDAIAYAKKFSEIFPKAGTPEIHLKSGLHQVILEETTAYSLLAWFAEIDSSGSSSRISYYNNLIKNNLFLDIPINIRGEGDTSILEIIYKLSASDGDYNLTSGLIVPGDGFNPSGESASYSHKRFNSGTINISNLYFKETGIFGIDLVNNDGINNLTFKLNIDNVTFQRLESSTASKHIFIISDFSGPFFYENDNNTLSKGNIFINNSRFLNNGRVYFAPIATPMRYKNIGITNCYSLSSSGISTPNFSNTSSFAYTNKVYSYGNITPNYISSDRAGENLIVANNLTVGNQVVSNNYYFSSTKTFERTFWAYSGQIYYDPGSSASKITAADPFIILTSSATRIDFNPLSGSFQVPSVQVGAGEFLTIPVEIHKNQNLKAITILLDASTTSTTINLSLLKMNKNDQTLGSVFLSTPITKSGSSYSLSYSYKADDEYSYFFMIENTGTLSQSFDRVRLTFQSTNLFELIGIS